MRLSFREEEVDLALLPEDCRDRETQAFVDAVFALHGQPYAELDGQLSCSYSEGLFEIEWIPLGDPGTEMMEIRELLEDDRRDEAMPLLQQLLAREPDHREARHVLLMLLTGHRLIRSMDSECTSDASGDYHLENTRNPMLTGTELLAKVKELGDASKSELVRECGYVSSKKDGSQRLNFTAFYEALLEAKGLSFNDGGKSRGKAGRALSYTAKVQFNGNLLVGKAYTAQLDLQPGDEFEIKLGRKQIQLIPIGAAAVDEE